MIFPSPNIDNEPVVSAENFTWQLIAHYIENSKDIWQVQMDNGMIAEFVAPRTSQPAVLPIIIKNTSHGPKVWGKLSGNYANYGNAMYQNEIYRIQTEFLIPENQADSVTLVNDQGEVWIAVSGYTGDNNKIINGEAWVKFSKWDVTHFETIFENSEIEWVSLQNEWQGYRLDD